MFKGQIINKLIEEKNTTKKALSDYVGISYNQIFRIIDGKAMPQADNLEKIADFFDVAIDLFFDRKPTANNQPSQNIGHTVTGLVNNVTGDISLSECQKELDHLRELLAGKDRIIEEKEKMIDEKERLITVLMNK